MMNFRRLRVATDVFWCLAQGSVFRRLIFVFVTGSRIRRKSPCSPDSVLMLASLFGA